MNYVNNKIHFGSDAEVKLFGGPIYDIYLIEATPTTLTVLLNLHEGLPAAEGENVGISSSQVYINDREIPSIGDNKYKVTGLAIDTQHDLNITIRYTDGNKADIVKTYRTLNPELTIQRPKCVSSTCAIVSATTHLSDDETSLGFQWKKYDAPESLMPNEAYAAVYHGTLEGYLKNLQPTSYFTVRHAPPYFQPPRAFCSDSLNKDI